MEKENAIAIGPKLSLIHSRRISKRYNLRDLAAKVGVSRQAISDYEKGKYPPKYDVWLLLRDALNLPGNPEDYWGREALDGKRPLYENMTCSYPNCAATPIARGLCSKHYQHKKYWSKRPNTKS